MTVKNEAGIRLYSVDHITPGLKSLQSTIIRFVGAVTAGFAAIRSVVLPVTAAAEFDRELRNVQKTTEFTDRQIQTFSADILELSTRLDTTAVELAQIASIAGQLGLGREGPESIIRFTESVARAKSTLDLTVEEAAAVGAQISNIFRIPTAETERIFAVINKITNTTIANASELGDIIRRIGTVAGLTYPEVSALAGAARELGTSPEVAGTSLAKIFANMQSKAENFAEILYNSRDAADEFLEALSKDRVGTLIQVLEKLSKIGAGEQASLINTLFGGGRISVLANKLLQDVTSDVSILRRTLEDANDEYEKGTSAIKEYENILKATTVQWQILSNIVKGRAIQAGNRALDEVNASITQLQDVLSGDASSPFFDSFGEYVESSVRLVTSLVDKLVTVEVAWKNLGVSIQAFVVALGGLIASRALSFVSSSLLGIAAAGSALVDGVLGKSAFIQFFNGSPGLDRTATRIGKVGSAFALLGRVVGRISSIIFGPVGFITLMVLSFTDLGSKLASFFGFVSKEEAALAREQRQQTLEFEEEIKKRITAYDSFIEGIESTNKELERISARETTGSTARQSQEDISTLLRILRESVAAYDALYDVAATYNKQQVVASSQQRQLGIEIDNNTKKLRELGKERLSLQRQIQEEEQDSGLSFGYDALTNQLARVNKEIETTQQSITKASQAYRLFGASAKNTAREVVDLIQSETQLREAINQAAASLEYRLTPAALNYLKVSLNRKKAVEEEVKAQERLAKFEEQNQITPEIDADEYTVVYTELANAVSAASREVFRLDLAIGRSKKSIGKEEIVIVDNAVLSVSNDLVEDFLRAIKEIDVAKARGRLFDIAKSDIVAAAVYVDTVEKLIDTYAKQFATVTRFATSAKSLLDNLNSTISSMRQGIEATIEALGDIENQKLLDKKEEVAVDKLNKKYDDLVSNAERFYDSRIQSGSGRASLLEKMKKDAIEDLETQRERAIAEARLASISERMAEARKEILRNEKELKRAATAGNPEEYSAVRDSMLEALEVLKELITERNSLYVDDRYDDKKITSLVDSEGLERDRSLLRYYQKFLEDTLTRTGETLNTSAQKNKKTLDDILDAPVSKLADMSKKITESLGGDEALGSLVADTLVAQLRKAGALKGVDQAATTLGSNIRDALGREFENIDQGLLDNLTSSSENLEKVIREAVSRIDVGDVYGNLGERVSSTLTDAIVKSLSGKDANDIEVGINEEELRKRIQDALDREEFLIELGVKPGSQFGGTGPTPQTKLARGGLIRGPGTGRSDSIPAWLSNGEYVIDDLTRRFYGAGFFKNLQDMARSGVRLKMPRFNSGGLAGGSTPQATQFMETVNLNINLGGDSFNVMASRDTAKNLARALQSLGRSSA